MIFKLYIELASRALDSRLLDLLRFPADSAFQASGAEWSTRWWEHGKTRRMKARQREQVIEKMKSRGFNELTLKWHSESAAPVSRIKVLDAMLEFFPSPMSELWAEVPLHTLKAHSEDVLRRNFRNIESVLTQQYKLPYPSTLECFLVLNVPDPGLSEAELQNLCVAWLRSVMPKSLENQEIFGYGCVHGSCRQKSMVTSLGLPEIDDLGEKFEGVYPILFGPRVSCEGLAVAIGDTASVVALAENSPAAIVSIAPDSLKSVSSRADVQNWLVPRPGPTRREEPKVIVVPPPKEPRPKD